jgi:hypothetical protein
MILGHVMKYVTNGVGSHFVEEFMMSDAIGFSTARSFHIAELS